MIMTQTLSEDVQQQLARFNFNQVQIRVRFSVKRVLK